MMAFARLLDGLVHAPARNTKLALLRDYFASTPDPDRGYALAAMTDGLNFPGAKPATIRALAEARVDPVLFRLSYDFVGDLAETVALIWPSQATVAAPRLSAIVETLQTTSRARAPALLEKWFDALDADGRWALIKLVTGGLRVGVSARLAKTALAEWGAKDLARIEEVWHGLTPPYGGLFAWLEDRGPMPEIIATAAFRPMMLAHPLEDGELDGFKPEEFRAEWKWDGIRVQLVAGAGTRIFSRTGEDVGPAFPELHDAAWPAGVIDGELMVRGEIDGVGGFNDLQQRLNRKTAPAALVAKHPAFIRAYDILFDGDDDVRVLPFMGRRERLEAWARRAGNAPVDLSPLVPFASWRDLTDRERPRAAEGLMLKRAASPYLAGRVKGHWYKWKREPRGIDAVLMYAQRGHGKRSSFYSDFTFGCWREGPDGRALVPVGKAYFGFTDEELAKLDRFVRGHTTESFGPVRMVEPTLVCELAFDAVRRSTRHKSGVALRFPRIARIRWDKPATEADDLVALEKMIED